MNNNQVSNFVCNLIAVGTPCIVMRGLRYKGSWVVFSIVAYETCMLYSLWSFSKFFKICLYTIFYPFLFKCYIQNSTNFRSDIFMDLKFSFPVVRNSDNDVEYESNQLM